MHLRDRIRTARERTNITRAALARRVGVRPSAAVQWESAKGTSPSVENLTRIANVLDVRFEWLTTGRGPMMHGEDGASALAMETFAHDSLEERVLVAIRRLPKRQRDAIAAYLEALVK